MMQGSPLRGLAVGHSSRSEPESTGLVVLTELFIRASETLDGQLVLSTAAFALVSAKALIDNAVSDLRPCGPAGDLVLQRVLQG